MKDEGRRGVFGCLSISEAEPQICMYSVLVIITGVQYEQKDSRIKHVLY